MSGSNIALQIEAGLIQAQKATGDGLLACCLEKRRDQDRPGETGQRGEHHDIVVTQTSRKETDGVGSVRKVVRVLLVSAAGEAIEKGDRVAIGIAKSDVTSETKFERVGQVEVVSPAGVPVLYKADLEG